MLIFLLFSRCLLEQTKWHRREQGERHEGWLKIRIDIFLSLFILHLFLTEQTLPFVHTHIHSRPFSTLLRQTTSSDAMVSTRSFTFPFATIIFAVVAVKPPPGTVRLPHPLTFPPTLSYLSGFFHFTPMSASFCNYALPDSNLRYGSMNSPLQGTRQMVLESIEPRRQALLQLYRAF